jgi:hypothetical protein
MYMQYERAHSLDTAGHLTLSLLPHSGHTAEGALQQQPMIAAAGGSSAEVAASFPT